MQHDAHVQAFYRWICALAANDVPVNAELARALLTR